MDQDKDWVDLRRDDTESFSDMIFSAEAVSHRENLHRIMLKVSNTSPVRGFEHLLKHLLKHLQNKPLVALPQTAKDSIHRLLKSRRRELKKD